MDTISGVVLLRVSGPLHTYTDLWHYVCQVHHIQYTICGSTYAGWTYGYHVLLRMLCYLCSYIVPLVLGMSWHLSRHPSEVIPLLGGSTDTMPWDTSYLTYLGMHPISGISGYLLVVCQDTHLRTPSEVIPLVGGSMDTMPLDTSCGCLLPSSHLYSPCCGLAAPGYSHTLLLGTILLPLQVLRTLHSMSYTIP